MVTPNETWGLNTKSEYQNPCLRRSACPPQGFWRRGFAQTGETNSKFEFQNPLIFVQEICILNISACFEFRLPAEQVLWQAGISCFEFNFYFLGPKIAVPTRT